jgi:hypothetical protein
VDQRAVVPAAEPLDQRARFGCISDRRWIAVVCAKQGRDDASVGIAIEEDLFDQRSGRVAVKLAGLTFLRLGESLTKRGPPLLTRRAFRPFPRRIDSVQLNVEDELVAR